MKTPSVGDAMNASQDTGISLTVNHVNAIIMRQYAKLKRENVLTVNMQQRDFTVKFVLKGGTATQLKMDTTFHVRSVVVRIRKDQAIPLLTDVLWKSMKTTVLQLFVNA